MIGILLAAGRGTRMKSEKSKLLCDINGEPLVLPPFKCLMSVCEKVIVVIGHQGPAIKEAITKNAINLYGEEVVQNKVLFFTQENANGTGDAVKTAMQGYSELRDDDSIIILNGDMPLLQTETLQDFISHSTNGTFQGSCLSTVTTNPKGLGRIVRDESGSFLKIVEEKDADQKTKLIKEINAGVYFFKASVLFDQVKNLKTDNKQKEFYLTDALKNGAGVKDYGAIKLESAFLDTQGVNTTYELANLREIAQLRLKKNLCEEYGLDFENLKHSYISSQSTFEGTCAIGTGSVLKGANKIGKDVIIEGNVQITNSTIKDSSTIKWGSVIDNSEVGPKASVGPMAHLRPNSNIKTNCKVGNFVELKNTTLKAGAKASHLAYLGDAVVGERSNIGCGTITCNYDGVNKHKTIIGQDSFIGSDTQLIAPVNVGNESYVASGTTVTQDIPDGAMALSRPELAIKEGYAKRLMSRFKGAKKNQEGTK